MTHRYPPPEREGIYFGPHRPEVRVPASSMCTDPEAVKPHARGSNPGSCHTCAMQYDAEYKLLPEEPFDPKTNGGSW